jgi:hypothetical protein
MTTQLTAGGTSQLDALDAPTITQGGVAMPRMVLATSQAATSGTAIDFTSIPSWVKRITIAMAGVKTSGTSAVRITTGGTDTFTFTAGTINILYEG